MAAGWPAPNPPEHGADGGSPLRNIRSFNAGLARFSQHLTVEAGHKPAITALRLLTVLNVGFKYARISQKMSRRAARLVLTGFSPTSPRHVVRKAG